MDLKIQHLVTRDLTFFLCIQRIPIHSSLMTNAELSSLDSKFLEITLYIY